MTSFYGSVNGGQGGGGEGIDTSTLMQKNNPTFNGTITGPNARFTGTVQIPEPTEDNHAATKGYVNAALADVDLSEVTTKIDAIETAQDELAAQLDDKVDAENPAFTGTATLNGKNIATVDQIPNISDLPYLDENNPTYTGTLTGAGATFSGVVSVPTPTQDGQAVNKQYVDQAIAGVQIEVDLSEVQADIAELQTGKLDKANPTYTGNLAGENAAFSGTVTVATPAAEGEAANKGYVDAAKTELEGDINTLQQTVASQTETINTLNQQVTNITGGTAELPYLKNTGDSGTGVYDFTGATVNAADPVDNSNVATKHYVDQKIASAGGTGEVVSYTQGDGINISPENIISVVIAADNANGLAVDTSGIKLNVATPTTAGAMSGADKAKLDASSTTEQMNQAISSAIDETLEDPTKLPFVNINGDTMHGSLTTTELFTDFVTIRNAGTDGKTGFQNNSDTDHIRVYDKVANTLVPIEVGEPVNNQDASTKKYVDDKITTETAARTEAIESLDEAKADKNNPTFTGTITGANATLSGTLTGNTATFSGGITVPLEPGVEGSATSKKYVDDKAGNYLPLAGGAMTGSIDAGENTVTNLKEPEEGTDATTKNYVDKAAIQRANDKIDAVYNSLVKKAESVDEVNQLFKDWWNANWEEGSNTYNDMLERWFGKVLDDDKVYGVKLPLFETSTSPQGEYIEDSVGLIVTNSTDEEVGQNDFTKTPQFWCVEVAAEKNADGSHTIYACEFIDDINVVRNGGPDNGKHLVWVLQKNTYVHEYEESGYSYIKIQCHPADDFVQWPQGTDRTGHTYSYIANPKYAAGIDNEGNIGCRTGLKPTCYMSMNQTIQAWRARGPQYSGSSACFYKWAYIMYALLTTKKGEDVGCNNYNYQYAAAVSESGVSRIILTADQANNLYVGSNVIIGNTEGNNDRNQAAMYNLVKLRKISSIEEVNIEEDVSSYKAVYIDVPDGTTFDTTAGTTYISTMPFYSGWTDSVKGTIGTKYGTNLNRQPCLLQKVELMNGAYNYASDELDQWSQQDDTHYLYDFYLCEDQTKVSTNGTITDDYIKKENATLTIDTAVYTTNNSWYYIEDNLTNNNFKMLNPKKISTSAGSGTGTRDSFYLSYAASGVRVPMVWAGLQAGGLAGLSCRASLHSPSWPYWDYAGGGPGLSG